MPDHSKRYTAALAAAGHKDGPLEPAKALDLVKKSATAKFDETVDVAVRLGVDPRHGDQMVRGTTSLPFGTGKTQKVAVFAKGDKADEAREAGADVVGAEDLAAQIQGGWKDFGILLATPDMMPVIGKLGAILRQAMPSPKAGTVTNDIGKTVSEIKKATRVEFRVEKGAIVHAPIGKVSYETENLEENLRSLISALLRAKPSGSKGRYLRKIVVSSTMGPGFAIDVQAAQELAERHH